DHDAEQSEVEQGPDRGGEDARVRAALRLLAASREARVARGEEVGREALDAGGRSRAGRRPDRPGGRGPGLVVVGVDQRDEAVGFLADQGPERLELLRLLRDRAGQRLDRSYERRRVAEIREAAGQARAIAADDVAAQLDLRVHDAVLDVLERADALERVLEDARRVDQVGDRPIRHEGV